MKSRYYFILRGFFLFTVLTLFTAGCGSNGSISASSGSPTSGGTGGVTAKLVWDATNNSSAQTKTTEKVIEKAAVGVSTVRVIISGPDMSNMQSDFPVADGKGTVNGIPAGSGRTVKVLGLDSTGLVKYQSEVNNITILAGQVTDLGTIIMQQIAYILSGQAQKGPLIFGSSIWASELDATLNSTGITYLAQTDDDLGNFYVGPNIGSNLVDLLGEGYYMDELTGGLSTSPITLRAVADLSVYSTPIINILTTIQRPRLKSLILAGQTYQAAMQQSQTEALAAFGIDATKITSLQALSAMQINGTTDQDSVLLATSAILSKMAANAATASGSSPAAEMTYYLSRIASDIKNTGVLSNAAIIASRNLAATQIDLATVRSNVETYYANRGFTYVAAKFEEWVDKDASGVLPRRLVPPTGLSFTDATGVEPQQLITSNTVTVGGLGTGVAVPVTVSAGTTIIKNSVAISGTSTTAIDGDTIAMRVTSAGYGFTSLWTISVGSSSATWRVATKLLAGAINGLTSTGLVLQNNGGSDITITAGSTSFTLPVSLANGASYNVTVLTQPTSPLQDCTVNNGTGTVGSAVSNISVVCSAVEFAYVANSGSDNVAAFRINATTGASTSIGTFAAGSYPCSITIDPAGKFAYVANNQSANVSAYSISASTGALTSIGAIAAGTNPLSIALDPTGKFVYVANAFSNNVSAFSINATTGALTSIGTIAAGTYPYSMAVDPNGKFAYVVNMNSNNVSAYSINAATGVLTSIGTIAVGTASLFIAIDPTGKFAYVTNGYGVGVSAYSINATTGALTSIGTTVTGAGAIAIDPTGKFAYEASGNAYSINASTGALTSIGTFATGTSPRSIAVDPTGKFAYVANLNSANVSAYSINASTGALTSIGTFATGTITGFGPNPHFITLIPAP
jgi:6-phosphogluconolactonase